MTRAELASCMSLSQRSKNSKLHVGFDLNKYDLQTVNELFDLESPVMSKKKSKDKAM